MHSRYNLNYNVRKSTTDDFVEISNFLRDASGKPFKETQLYFLNVITKSIAQSERHPFDIFPWPRYSGCYRRHITDNSPLAKEHVIQYHTRVYPSLRRWQRQLRRETYKLSGQ